ncbi:tRNA 2-selenouridine(34) synthase MnmH [Magnetovibrio sp. PR-2]|uniref:tRNA 2-selenouridine(34) synthase MnmH n=1 Tax=Magnetovibrio sp. PR-2 TaxID=3120356 RepID=UPI002FCE5BB0
MPNLIVPKEQFEELLIADTPFLDVRAEIEFSKGRFPTSTNIPILHDDERQKVGTCYKEKGRESAIELGHSLVSGITKDQRIQAWCDFAARHQNTHIYCWRGGMRSNYAQAWMSEAGMEVPLIEGGFKALRRVVIDQISDAAERLPIIRIGGKTGTAKTPLVNEIEFSTDLEGHANHRGSSFGRRVSGPPTQVDFEHALGIDLLRKRRQFPNRTLIVEDEGRRIGSCIISQDFFHKMCDASVAIVEMPMEFRVQRIIQEYVVEMLQDFLNAHPTHGWDLFVEYLSQSLTRVQKRLGLENYKRIAALMDDALRQQDQHGDISGHEAWVNAMLIDYYDPMYAYQLEKKSEKVVFQGSYNDVLNWAHEQSRPI